MSNLNTSKISEVKIFKSDLKDHLNKPFDNNGLILMLCSQGYAILSIDFKKHIFKKGDIAIIPEGMSLIPISTSSTFNTEIISANAKQCEETEYKITDMTFWNFMTQNPILHTNTMQYDILCNWFAQMKWIIDDNTYTFSNETISSSIFTFFMLTYRETGKFRHELNNETKIKRTPKIFTNFTNLVARYHKKNREVAFYANLLFITPDYLNKICKMHWNTSAKEYIDLHVIMAIKNYLSCTDLSIKSIAAQIHFEDPSYMCRFFKKMTGMSPIQFRNEKR